MIFNRGGAPVRQAVHLSDGDVHVTTRYRTSTCSPTVTWAWPSTTTQCSARCRCFCALLSGAVVMIVNLLVDVFYAIADPRVSLS